MKNLLFCLFFILFAIPANAVTTEAFPVVCDKSKLVFEQLKASQYKPVMMGNVKAMTTLIFVNPSRDMVITMSIKVDTEHMTCIFIAGEGNAELL